MTKQYTISGMTCGGCVIKVLERVQKLPALEHAKIRLTSPQATLTMNQEISLATLQQAIGKYKIDNFETATPKAQAEELRGKTLSTYKPLILIIAFILGVTLIVQFPFDEFSATRWLRHFMAGFFLVFSFFKLLNIRGFVESYQMYDIVAKRWKFWGYSFPFIELALGILYLINLAPIATNLATLIILGVSSVGVIQSNINNRKIKCACLGDVFNLPMSTVTIVEDLAMAAMAGGMLVFLLI